VASTPQDAIQLADSALASIKIEVDPLI